MAIFRWQPNRFLVALAFIGLIVTGFAFTFLPPPLGLPLLFVWAMLGMRFSRAFDYSLTFDDRSLTLLRGRRACWKIQWTDLQEVRYEPGPAFSKNYDHLVLQTGSRTRCVILNDTLFGRWSDPRAILLLFRERGYLV